MDHEGMRAWMKKNQQSYMLTERTFSTLLEEKETEVLELRVMMLRGEMDYTAAVIEPIVNVKADRQEAVGRMFKRLHWETERDTGVALDYELGMENGNAYQAEKKS